MLFCCCCYCNNYYYPQFLFNNQIFQSYSSLCQEQNSLQAGCLSVAQQAAQNH